MILSREVTIKINEYNSSYYEELGYDVFSGDEITIPVELLSKGSHYIISCKCDMCSVIKNVIYKNYLKYGNIFGQYLCRKCSESKRKKTLNENHGVDYPIQSEDIKNKIINTMIKIHGVDNPSKSEKIQSKKVNNRNKK